MNDRMLVEAVLSGRPGALDAVFDAYADRLYTYCWFLVRKHDIAQVALRDAFIVARARMAELADPERLGPWLYALARHECARRDTAEATEADVPIAAPDQEDVDLRVIAWHAVRGLSPLSRELLELRIRHRLAPADLADVYALPVREVNAELDRARDRLERAVVAEILAQRQPYECDRRRRILLHRRGDLTDELRGRLLRHARECATCAAHGPRTVSAAKVYGLLPRPETPTTLRIRVMSSLGDPELAGYRAFAAERAGPFGPNGFPTGRAGRGRRMGRRATARLAAGLDELSAYAAPGVHGAAGIHGASGGRGGSGPSGTGVYTGGTGGSSSSGGARFSGRMLMGLTAGALAVALAATGLRWLGGLLEDQRAVRERSIARHGSPVGPPHGAAGRRTVAEAATFPLGARVPAIPPTALPISPRYSIRSSGPGAPGAGSPTASPSPRPTPGAPVRPPAADRRSQAAPPRAGSPQSPPSGRRGGQGGPGRRQDRPPPPRKPPGEPPGKKPGEPPAGTPPSRSPDPPPPSDEPSDPTDSPS
jgi:DNA-directed RNA polymerase specialized sigma24 family protein